MFGTRCIRLNIPSVLLIILSIVLNGVKYSNSKINDMEQPATKVETKKNISVPNSEFIPFANLKQPDVSSCPNDLECKNLPGLCVQCKFNSSCLYGKENTVNCEARKLVQCTGDREFKRTTICRYCWQTEPWEHSCVQNVCNSIHQLYLTNCTVNPDLLCLGKRSFVKRIRCNWTQGYKWSTALIISITLGGFGADRFYLGHWQEGIGKLFSFGGLGVWTLIDVILISLHYLGPADGSLYL